MSRKDAVIVASRTLALLLIVWAVVEVSYLPEMAHSFLRYAGTESTSSAGIQYWHHYHLLRLTFCVVRLIGFSLVARWLYKGGPEVDELLLPAGSTNDPDRG